MNYLTRFLLLVMLLATVSCSTTGTRDRAASARDHTQLGLMYMQNGQNGVALDELNKALDADSNWVMAHGVIALLYQKLGENKDAKKHFKKSVMLDPGNSELHNNYGSFLCATGELEAAQKQFSKALDNPVYATPDVAYTNAGICKIKQQDLAGAEQYLLQALRYNGKYSQALFHMAKLSFDQKSYQLAKSYLLRFHEVSDYSAATLALLIGVEQQLDDRDAVATNMLLLRRRFPDSAEAIRTMKPGYRP